MLKILRIALKFFTSLILVIAILLFIGFLYYVSVNFKASKSILKQSFFNITYKTVESDRLKLDLYMPKRKLFPKIPVLVYFHGGSFKSGSKNIKGKDLENFSAFLEAGFALVSVDYRLTSEKNKYPIHFEDAADSIRWLVENADIYGLDKNRINLIGASAGSTIALQMGLAGDQYGGASELADVDFDIRSIIDVCGLTDFTDINDFEALFIDFFGGTYDEMKDVYQMASPINHIHKKSTPIFMVHGKLDEVVPFKQAEKFYQKALSVNAKVKFVPVENASHEFKTINNKDIEPALKDVFIEMVLFLMKYNIF